MKNEKRRIAMRKDIIIESPPCYLWGEKQGGGGSHSQMMIGV